MRVIFFHGYTIVLALFFEKSVLVENQCLALFLNFLLCSIKQTCWNFDWDCVDYNLVRTDALFSEYRFELLDLNTFNILVP